LLMDIGRLRELSGIREQNGMLIIGAGTTHYAAESSTLLQQRCPLLAETAAAIGDIQVRNRGTIGGSIAHADPAADWPAALLALDADVQVMGRQARTIPAREFFIDLMTTAVQPGEILTGVRVPIPRGGHHYEKVRQPASGFALVGIAVQLVVEGGVCASIAIGVTG